MMRYRHMGLGIALALGVAVVACADDNPAQGDLDAADAGVEAGRHDTGPGNGDYDSGQDSGTKDAANDVKDAGVDADADAGPLPGVVSDLAGAADTHRSVTLTWTAPADYTGTGTVADYDIRYSTTPITTEAEFLAATALATTPYGEKPGTSQTATLQELTPETPYYVALRARYDNDDLGPLSNVVTVTTKARARFLISEIAPANSAASGGDFVELVATKAGYAAGLTVGYQFTGVLHTLAPLDVQVGDRVVIHLGGLPGPTGFVQEDATKSKTSSTAANASANAYDVYSAATDLDVDMETIVVSEPGNWWEDTTSTMVQDLVPYGSRMITDPEIMGFRAIGYLFGDLFGYWPHPFTEEQWYAEQIEEPCQIYATALNSSGDDTPACGGPAAGLTDGRSMQRNGTVDTNTAADFTVAPQTRGAPN